MHYQVLKHDLGTLCWSAGKRTNDNLNREFKHFSFKCFFVTTYDSEIISIIKL